MIHEAEPDRYCKGFLPILALLAIVGLGWCVAHGKLNTNSWGYPTVYLNPVYADFIGSCVPPKQFTEGNYVPFVGASAPEFAAPERRTTSGGGLTLEEALQGLFGILVWAIGLFPGFNLGVLIGHLVGAATFYLVARRGFAVGDPWAFVGGLAFGLAPYQFAQQPHHVNCQFVWYLPLFPLVWKWIATGEDLSVGTRRFWQATAIGFITGLQNPYYSNIFCQLVLVCGVLRCWQLRSWPALSPAATVIAAVLLGFFVVNLDTITYRVTRNRVDDSNSQGVGGSSLLPEREYKWMDIYGFKLVDLFIPPITHHANSFAIFGRNHRAASVLSDEEGSGYLGLLGIGCLLFLTGVAVRALVEGRVDDVPLEAWWVLWIIIMFTTGGLNAIIAAFTGFTLFRTAIRYSIVVLLLALLYAGTRLTAWQQRAITTLGPGRVQAITLAATIASTALVLWDQLPRTPTATERAAIADAVDSDRAFVTAMEAALPVAADGKKPMVFQLPVLGGPGRPTIPSSHHARPYLYSRNLHYSSGASGDTLRWQLEVQRQLFRGAERGDLQQPTVLYAANVRQAIEMLQEKGFAAVYVNRAGYPDRAAGLEAMLKQLGYDRFIDSPRGDLLCVPLE